jgi:hypothetical protein
MPWQASLITKHPFMHIPALLPTALRVERDLCLGRGRVGNFAHLPGATYAAPLADKAPSPNRTRLHVQPAELLLAHRHIDITAMTHLPGPQSPRECHLYVAEGAVSILRLHKKSRLTHFMESASDFRLAVPKRGEIGYRPAAYARSA